MTGSKRRCMCIHEKVSQCPPQCWRCKLTHMRHAHIEEHHSMLFSLVLVGFGPKPRPRASLRAPQHFALRDFASALLQCCQTLYPPPLVVPHPREDGPPPPPGGWSPSDGPPPPPWGTTPPLYTHICRHKNCSIKRKNSAYASPCSECPTTCAKTGSPVERMNITLVPGGNMVVLSSSISAKKSKMSCHECKGCKW